VQEYLYMEVEELDQSNPISLSVERRRGTFGRLTVHWAANGSLTDIFPTSGVVSQPIADESTSSPKTKCLIIDNIRCATCMAEAST